MKKNEQAAGELVDLMLPIYKGWLNQEDGPTIGQMKEIREFLKQHDIELDPATPELQDLNDDATDELNKWRNRRAGAAPQ